LIDNHGFVNGVTTMAGLNLSPDHPLYVKAQQERARMAQWRASAGGRSTLQAARARMMPYGSDPLGTEPGVSMHESLLRSPDEMTRQGKMPLAGTNLMDPARIAARHGGDPNFAGGPVGSGVLGVAGSEQLTGGGAPGSLRADQAAQKRGRALMAGLPPLKPFAPSWTPSERRAGIPKPPGFGIAQQGGPAPQGVAATAGTPSPLRHDLLADTGPTLEQGRSSPAWAEPDEGLHSMPPLGAALAIRPAPVPTAHGQIDPRLVGNKQQVARAQAAIKGASAPAAAGPRNVPINGIANGIGAIGQAIGRMFAGGGPQAQEQPQPPSVQIMADAAAERDRAIQAGYPNRAHDYYANERERATREDIAWHAQNRADKQHVEQMGLNKQQLAATQQQHADELAERRRTNDIEAAKTKAETDRIAKTNAMSPAAQAIADGIARGTRSPLDLDEQTERERALRDLVGNPSGATTEQARQVLTSAANPFGPRISQHDFSEIFPADKPDRPGVRALQRMRELGYKVGPEFEGDPFNDLARKLIGDYAGAENIEAARTQKPRLGTEGLGYPATAFYRDSPFHPESLGGLGQVIGAPVRALSLALSGYNPVSGQQAADRDYAMAQRFYQWLNSRKK
jgi:hypothetical protein